ncbi:MAG: non-homologous end-joining DNA ligase [Vicinamibacterales bacterium]
MQYRPQLAQLAKDVPRGNGWLHEIKYDGYRIGCLIDAGTVTLVSRSGKDWTAAFPEICSAARLLPVRRALIDGEAAMVMADGRTSFQALQNAFSGGSRARLVYFAFDLLHLDGQDLACRPIEERKEMLRAIIIEPRAAVRRPAARSSPQLFVPRPAVAGTVIVPDRSRGAGGGRIRYSEHIVGDGERVLREACRLRLEGVVSKRLGVPYRAGRSADWVKTKCVNRQEVVIGGYTDPEGSREGIGALLVGCYEGPRLVFAGKVGTGFTQKSAATLRSRLEKLASSESPFEPPPPGVLGRRAHFVRPVLVAEVAFAEWTSDGRLRHPSFLGLRQDRDPRTVTRDDLTSG